MVATVGDMRGDFKRVAVLELIPEAPKQIHAPDLCEIWTWQGDTSVLPHKFESVLNAAATEPDHLGWGKNVFNADRLARDFIDVDDFDPEGFFFLTHRSNAIGLAMC